MEYVYDSRDGSGTYAYIIDTGLLTTHTEFGNRAFFVYNAVADSTSDDNVGHGTHIAGTIGSLSYGVAKQTTLLSVKVLDSETVSAKQSRLWMNQAEGSLTIPTRGPMPK